MLVIERAECSDVEAGLRKEWLVTNGLGGYASSTIAGANTRRYHGLLVASLVPPFGRTLLLAKIDEELSIDGRSYYLSTNEYLGNVIHPSGFIHLEECRLDGTIPTFRFETREATLSKTVWMENGRNTTYIRYRLEKATGPATLALTLLCNHRHVHALTEGSLDWNFELRAIPGYCGCMVKARAATPPYILLATPSAKFTPTGAWYWHYAYRADRERGYEHVEDLYSPGLFRATLNEGETLTVIASAEPIGKVDRDAEKALRRERRRQAKVAGNSQDEFLQQLLLAADQFVVIPRDSSLRRRRRSGKPVGRVSTLADGMKPVVPAGILNRHSVVAGYHWFLDWGRDTLICLPGLTLSTGRFELAKEILRTYAHLESEGLMPNAFADRQEQSIYGAADVSLWYFLALYRYLEATRDDDFLEEIYPVLARVVDWYCKGTRNAVKADPKDGLLRAGEQGSNVSWMDAAAGGRAVTPRNGKAVEINALWYNALAFMEEWSHLLGRPYAQITELRERVKKSFARRFWYKEGSYLYDVLDTPDGDDASLRPNQLFAISLPHSLLSVGRAKAVLEAVTSHLLTPFGLRTLAPSDHAYIGHYVGNEDQRNKAYHQGTAWAWLIGAYADAVAKIYGDRKRIRPLLESFKSDLLVRGLATVGEVWDGDAPHRGRGCIAQAWSVAELLRIWVRDE